MLRFFSLAACTVLLGLLTIWAARPTFSGDSSGVATAPPKLVTPTSQPTLAQFGGGDMAGGMGGMGGGCGMFTPSPAASFQKQAPASAVAQATRAALDTDVELPVGPMELTLLPQHIQEAAGVPVLLDQRGLKVAGVESSSRVDIASGAMPLRTLLRKVLTPLNLKVVVEEEGLAITVDPVAMARDGKLTSQWVGIDQAGVERIDEALETVTSFALVDAPLEDILRQISQDEDLQISLDVHALEEIGLSGDVPLDLAIQKVPLRAALELLLGEVDLTYVNRGNYLQITTAEAAEKNLLTRIYWLDGTGTRDIHELNDAIQASIEPETWEQLGGPSTIVPLEMQHRDALVVSATTRVHEDLESFLEVMRANHFGAEAVYDKTEAPQSAPGGMGGISGGSVPGGMF